MLPQRIMCLLLLASSSILLHFASRTLAVEVQATHEWTLLGDNDTVDAGMHIRMDLETGQKWVKLLADDATADVTVDGSTQIIASDVSSADAKEKNDDPSSDERQAGIQFDYDMMHRTLSNLPQEEKDRMQLPETLVPKNAEARPQFEEQMFKIWTERQATLQQFQQQVDLPKILQDRIQQLRDYLETDTLANLQRVDPDREHEIGNLDPTDIVSVLYDLEYQLSDIDMTRDFHTLGGWPLLVSLLDPNIHLFNASQSVGAELVIKMDVVQLHAAWAIGTAVKNQQEFHVYAIEPITIPTLPHQTTTLDVLTNQIASFSQLEYDFSETQKLNKYLYALGSLLRGNREAQGYFCANRGADRLGTLFARAVEVDTSPSHKVAVRLLTLADDIVTDTSLHKSASQQVDDVVAHAFTSASWCSAALLVLSKPSTMNESSLRAIRSMLPYCKWTGSLLTRYLKEILLLWESGAANTDNDVQKEQISLLTTVIDEAGRLEEQQ